MLHAAEQELLTRMEETKDVLKNDHKVYILFCFGVDLIIIIIVIIIVIVIIIIVIPLGLYFSIWKDNTAQLLFF